VNPLASLFHGEKLSTNISMASKAYPRGLAGDARLRNCQRKGDFKEIAYVRAT